MTEKGASKEKTPKVSNGSKIIMMIWKYSLIIALALIVGYLALVGTLLVPILSSGGKPSAEVSYRALEKAKEKTDRVKQLENNPQARPEELEKAKKEEKEAEDKFIKTLTDYEERRDKALDAIKTLTAVFGPWIAALVAFYFTGGNIEKMAELQKAYAEALRPDSKRRLKGVLVKDIMERYDPVKHNLEAHSETELTDATIIGNIVMNAKDLIRKGAQCLVVLTPPPNPKPEGILNISDILKIEKHTPVTPAVKLEEFTTDFELRVVKAEPTQTLEDIKSSLDVHVVLPVVEGEKIVGFVYREEVFKLLGGES